MLMDIKTVTEVDGQEITSAALTAAQLKRPMAERDCAKIATITYFARTTQIKEQNVLNTSTIITLTRKNRVDIMKNTVVQRYIN